MKGQGKKIGAHLYFMNDKNIRDALVSKRVKQEHIKQLLFDRGFIVSDKASKEELLDKVGTLHFDYNEYMYLAGVLENPDRKESISSTNIEEKVQSSEINKAINSVINDLKKEDISIEIKSKTNGKVVLKTTHVDVDFSKTAMKQRTRKHGEIEIEIDDNLTKFRFSATEAGKKVKDGIINKLSEFSKKEIKPIEISFENEPSEIISEFFVDLISNIKGHKLEDVVKVSVKKSNSEKEATEDEQSAVSGLVRQAFIAGEGLLLSKLYRDLSEQNFYIYKIQWKISDGEAGSDHFNLEAQFGDAAKTKDFKYVVKHVNRYNRGKVNLSTSQPEKYETDTLSTLIYESALLSYNKIVDRHNKNELIDQELIKESETQPEETIEDVI